MATKYWEDRLRTLYLGDSRRMTEISDESIQMVVTSPPYWGLRKYSGLPDLVWDGKKDCQHQWQHERISLKKSNQGVGSNFLPITDKIKELNAQTDTGSAFCSLCGAWQGQLGLEPTPELYLDHLVEIFREVRRVLRKDGVVFLNIGDSYYSQPAGNKTPSGFQQTSSGGLSGALAQFGTIKHLLNHPVIKSKDLCLIPFRLAIALQSAGWWVRSVIIWSKNNPMPESVSSPAWEQHKTLQYPDGRPYKSIRGQERPKEVTWRDCPGCEKCLPNDGLYLYGGSWRPTESHEYVLMLTKSNDYYSDAEAVREPNAPSSLLWGETIHRMHGNGQTAQGDSGLYRIGSISAGRNLRSVWTFPTQSYAEAHFACVDSETEILTIEGWKKYTDIKWYANSPQHILVATYNLKAQVIEYQPLSYIKEYDCNELIKVGSRDLDILMTPNHRNVVKKRTGVEEIVLTNELSYSDKIRVSAPIHYPVNKGIGATFAELIGWIITEGHYKKGGYIEIYQNEGKTAERIDNLLAKLEIPHTRHTRRGNQVSWFLKNSPMVEWCITHIPDKKLNRFLVSLPLNEAMSLFNSLISGDGCVRKDDARISFIQKDKQTKDWFQILALRLGYHSIQSGKTVYLTRRTYIGIRNTNGKGKNVQPIQYSGKVWCPKTPNGTWVARRNGRIFITGNTYPEKLVEICVKAATPEAGCCSKCGKPWVRIIERGKYNGHRRSDDMESYGSNTNGYALGDPPIVKTLGWQAGCKCGLPQSENIGSIVLDPFAGSGTTLKVAAELNRRAIGYELSEDYVKLAVDRNKQGILV